MDKVIGMENPVIFPRVQRLIGPYPLKDAVMVFCWSMAQGLDKAELLEKSNWNKVSAVLYRGQ